MDTNNIETKEITINGIYNIYVKDKMDNMATQEIKINTFANEGTADIGDGILIKKIHVSSDWNGDTNNNVQITFNNNINYTKGYYYEPYIFKYS